VPNPHKKRPSLRAQELYPDVNGFEARQEATHGLTPQKVCEAIAAEHGMISHIALRLGVSVAHLRVYLGKSSVCAKALLEAREAMGDVAERKLYDLIAAGDVRCIIYYLSTVHKRRGYGLKNTEEAQFGEAKQIVNTVNIVAIPSGQFLSKDEIANLTIDNYPAIESPAPPLAACLQ
jgi:hypothetical protein